MPRMSYIPGDFDLRVGKAKTGLGLFAESEIPKGANFRISRHTLWMRSPPKTA